jgi:hypothetical protein
MPQLRGNEPILGLNRPQDVTEARSLRHKGGVKDSLAHFGVSGVKGVRVSHNKNHKFMKFENTLFGKGCGHAGWSRGVEVHA